ncbi:MAG TPA: FkbM family methyltransferase [Caulobacteraceae bacterium]|jgi:FkbM family methyltransferase
MSSKASDLNYSLKGHEFSTADLELMMYLGFREDELDVLWALEDKSATSQSGFIVDRYGVKTRVTSLWPEAKAMDGHVYGVPVTGNFNWEAIEWIGLMRAVLEAGDTFRVMELGAGWGPAIVSSSVMARLRGIKDIRMTGVEGDPHHYAFMVQHLKDNGFDPAEHRLHQAAVAVREGVAQWPVTEDSSGDYGFRPIEASGDYMDRKFAATQDVRLLPMRSLVLSEDKWDLIHIDVQGSEYDICKDALPELNARAKRVMIGTHSRKLEGDLIKLFMDAGWILENEKPCKFEFRTEYKSLEGMTMVDGTQTWRHPGAQLPLPVRRPVALYAMARKLRAWTKKSPQ